MKKTTFLLLFYFGLSAMAAAQIDYHKADSFATNFKQKYEDIDDLAKQLTAPFSTAPEKARVLFTWVAANIRYDVDKFMNPPPRPRFEGRTKAEMEANAKEWHEKQLAKALKAKKGVCADYSKIYKAMCDAVGLECEYVTGDARDFYRPYRNVHNNPHAWNAVKWDSNWHLIDATWGAGYVHEGKFERNDNPGYFDTPPAVFSQNHLPDDEKWQLLEKPLTKKDFANQPLIQYGQNEYPIEDFSQTVELQGKDRVVRIKFSRTPKFYRILLNQNKRLEVTQKLENGWVELRFKDPGAGKEIAIFCGEKEQGNMRGFAKYEIR
jgi:transglutaminase/protease-like cytokinesis protein 3